MSIEQRSGGAAALYAKGGSMVAALVAALVALGAVTAWAQDSEKDADKLEEQLLQELEEGAGLIGVAAYREVLESGDYLIGPGDQFLVAITGVEAPVTNREARSRR